MTSKTPKIHYYKKSFLLFWHILLGGAFLYYTYLLIDGYTRNILIGTLLSLSIAVSYMYVLNISAKLFNKQQIGAAYFLTITGFLVGVFVQIMTCSNSIDAFMMH